MCILEYCQSQVPSRPALYVRIAFFLAAADELYVAFCRDLVEGRHLCDVVVE